MTVIEFQHHIIQQENALRSFAFSLTSNKEDAQDLLQETYLKALVYRDRFVEATNLRAWMFTIMKNIFINGYRRKVKGRSILVEADEKATEKLMRSKPLAATDSLMEMKEIQKAIDILEDDFKVPFTKYFQGYKYREIADEMELPIGTVKSRIFSARKKLMEELAE